MKRLRATTPVLIMLSWIGVVAQASAKDCEAGATSMGQVRECIYDEATKPLDKTYNDLLQYIRNRNKDAADHLAAAERSWEQFRGDTCDYNASIATDGYIDDNRIDCIVTFTEARVKMLQYYRKQFDESLLKQMQGNH